MIICHQFHALQGWHLVGRKGNVATLVALLMDKRVVKREMTNSHALPLMNTYMYLVDQVRCNGKQNLTLVLSLMESRILNPSSTS